jgi:hypothetical protein
MVSPSAGWQRRNQFGKGPGLGEKATSDRKLVEIHRDLLERIGRQLKGSSLKSRRSQPSLESSVAFVFSRLPVAKSSS